jgi:hypothetical protein
MYKIGDILRLNSKDESKFYIVTPDNIRYINLVDSKFYVFLGRVEDFPGINAGNVIDFLEEL